MRSSCPKSPSAAPPPSQDTSPAQDPFPRLHQRPLPALKPNPTAPTAARAPHWPKTCCRQQEQLLIPVHGASWLPAPGQSCFWGGTQGPSTGPRGFRLPPAQQRRLSRENETRGFPGTTSGQKTLLLPPAPLEASSVSEGFSERKTTPNDDVAARQRMQNLPGGSASPQQKRFPRILPLLILPPSVDEIGVTAGAALSCTKPTS